MDLNRCHSPTQILQTFNSFEPKASFNVHHCWRILQIRRGSMELGRLHDLRQSWHLWEQAIYLWTKSNGLKGPQTRRCIRPPRHNLPDETNINIEGDSDLSSLFPTAESNFEPSGQLTTSKPNSTMNPFFESRFDESNIDPLLLAQQGNHMDILQYWDPYSAFSPDSPMQDIQSSFTGGENSMNNTRYDDPEAAYL